MTTFNKMLAEGRINSQNGNNLEHLQYQEKYVKSGIIQTYIVLEDAIYISQSLCSIIVYGIDRNRR